MRKLLYLVNPISGTKKKPQLIKKIAELTTKAGIPFQILYTRADGNYTELSSIITNEKFTDVIICGGDGTVSTVTSFLLNQPINIGIIPMGSGNGLALTAGIPYSTQKALDIIFSGYAQPIDGFRINNKFSCMMCGFGNDAEIAHEFALTKVRGLKTYLRLSAKKYFNLKPYRFTIRSGNSIVDTKAFFITVSNSNQFGNYVTIAPRASLNDGLLDIVVVKKMNRLLLPFALAHQIAVGNKISKISESRRDPIIYLQCSELTISNPDNAPIHIDGEPQPPSSEIIIEIIPNAFRLLQPYRSSARALPVVL